MEKNKDKPVFTAVPSSRFPFLTGNATTLEDVFNEYQSSDGELKTILLKLQ